MKHAYLNINIPSLARVSSTLTSQSIWQKRIADGVIEFSNCLANFRVWNMRSNKLSLKSSFNSLFDKLNLRFQLEEILHINSLVVSKE